MSNKEEVKECVEGMAAGLMTAGPCVAHEFEAEEYTQAAGMNVACESKIPMEEDKETNHEPDSFEIVYVNFMMLHPQEQNEIIAQVMSNRNSELTSAKKEVERLENLYFKNLHDKL